MRRAWVLGAIVAVAACGGSDKPPARTATPSPSAQPAPTATVAIAPADQAACTALFARLQRVSVALGSSSSLLAQSSDKQDLAGRIATEQTQLRRSATLMDSAVVPAPLQAANRRLVAALRRFSRDFGRARAPARRGDFQAATSAMTDRVAVTRILAAARTIQAACGG
jgi:hypothetical protein